MIEADLAEFVDDDKRAGERGIPQEPVDERRLAGAEESGDDVDRQRPLRRSSSTGMSLPTNTGGPEGAPVGEPPGGSMVTA